MIEKRINFFLGLFIFLIPFFGFPSSWKMALTIISGLALMASATKFEIKKVPRKAIKRKEKTFVKNIAIQHETQSTEDTNSSIPSIE